MSNKPKVGRDGIYDARQLGTPKMLVLGFQHMFACLLYTSDAADD